MKITELLEDNISDFLARSRDPLRRHPGNDRSDAELLKFHKDSLANLGADSYKSHRAYHERWIRKLEKRMK
jgi:hypothetical protein